MAIVHALFKHTTLEEEPSQKQSMRGLLFDYIRHPACKRLINRIYTGQRDKGIKSITVLSQFAGEGKTLFTSVMALGFMALLDKRVLIMDTVNQTRDESFYYRGLIGNSPIISSKSTKRSACIDFITTKHMNSHKGPNSDSETERMLIPRIPNVVQKESEFDSADFQVPAFIDSMKSSYDLIMLDTCAITQASKDTFDPLILAQYTDTSILVAAQSSLEVERFSSITRDLLRHKISPMGLVIDLGVV